MSSPFISVIIPVYNVQHYLSRCIDSVLKQTYTDFELLLIDDGSPDSSGFICDQYAKQDSRIRVWHKENGGVSSARNRGLQEAIGEWIVFVDSDDYVEKDYLKDFVLSSPNQDLVMQGLLLKEGDGRIREILLDNEEIVINQLNPETVAKNKILDYGYPFGKFFRHELIQRYRLKFDESLHLHEDHLFFFDYLSVIDKIRLLHTAHYYYCLQGSGMSLSRKILPFRELLYASDRFLKKYEQLVPKYRLTEVEPYLKDLKYYMGVSQRVKALYSFYLLQHPDKRMSRRCLKQEFVEKRSLYKEFYRPKSVSGRISKCLFLYVPVPLLDPILRFVVCVFRKVINKKFSIS